MKPVIEFNLSVPWGVVAAKAWGDPKTFPILCVHGILDNAGAFDRLIALLPDNYYYVAIDLPGHGKSSHFPPAIPLDFFNYVLTIRYIIAELKWKMFYYIGHSLGGQLGTFYSIIYPDKIKKIILIEGFLPVVGLDENVVDKIKKIHDITIEAQTEREDHLYTHDEIIHTLQFKRSLCLNSDAAKALFQRSVSRVENMFKLNRDFRLRGFIRVMFSLEQIVSIVEKLKVPFILFMTVSTTETVPKTFMQFLQNLIESIKNSEIIIVEGNHDVHNNHPDRISDDISKFVNSNNIVSKL